MKRISILIVVAGLLISSASLAYVGPPRLIPVQGVLTDASGIPISGEQSIKFSIYDAETAGTVLWAEVQSIPVVDGFFTAYMGDATTIDLALFKDHFDLWLGVKVGAAEELPRVYIGSTPYSAFAQYCGTVPAHTHPFNDITGTIGGDQITNASLTNAKIADDAVFVSIRNLAGVSQFDVTNSSNNLKIFGAGLASVTFDAAKHLVTINAEITSPIPITLGGTGSAVQNFVDLTGNQTIAGTKTFSAAPSWGSGVATGNIDGNAAGFTGVLAGDVTGNQSATVVASVGAKTAAEIAQSVADTQAATYDTTGNTIVRHGVKGELKAYMFFYDAPAIKYVDVPSMAFLPPSPATTWATGSIYGIHRYITGGGNYLVAPVAGLPTDNGTTVTGFVCEIFDNSTTYNVTAELLAQAGGFSPTSIGSVSSSGAQASIRTISKSGLNTNMPARLFFVFQANISCGSDCSIGYCRVSYTAAGP